MGKGAIIMLGNTGKLLVKTPGASKDAIAHLCSLSVSPGPFDIGCTNASGSCQK